MASAISNTDGQRNAARSSACSVGREGCHAGPLRAEHGHALLFPRLIEVLTQLAHRLLAAIQELLPEGVGPRSPRWSFQTTAAVSGALSPMLRSKKITQVDLAVVAESLESLVRLFGQTK